MSHLAPRAKEDAFVPNLAANQNSTYANQGQDMATYVNYPPGGPFWSPAWCPLCLGDEKSNRNQTNQTDF